MGNTTSSKQIKTWIGKLIPYAALGLTLIATSRQIQILRTQAVFAQPVSYFRNSTQNKACHIAKDSILGYYEKGRGKTLIIILDAYPSESLYKFLTGKNSQLHEFLKKESSERRENYTPYPVTMYSLAYLLGGVSRPGSDCHYPFFGKNDKPPRQLIGNPYIQDGNQFCQEDKSISIPILAQMLNKPRNERENCTLLLSKFRDQLSKYLNIENAVIQRNSIDVLHDNGFHDILLKPIKENCLEEDKKGKGTTLMDQLEKADTCYKISINAILHNQSKAKMYDRIIIMSDHGPRIPIPLLQTGTILNTTVATKNPKAEKLRNKGGLVDRNYYQFFSYGINITEKARRERIRVPENIFNESRSGIEGETDKPRLIGRK